MISHYQFVGGHEGQWRVTRFETVAGPPLEAVRRVNVVNAPFTTSDALGTWVLRGFTSNKRYAERREVDQLQAKEEDLGRPTSRCAALIPIRKTPEWWELAQDERRAIFEEQSHHTEIGLRYLPEIARQLHHSRDLGEPFDFLTWFEFAPEDTALFDELLVELRTSTEWRFVDREVDIRLTRSE